MQKVFGGGGGGKDSRKKQKQNDRWLPEEEKFAVELVLKGTDQEGWQEFHLGKFI